MTQGSLLRNTLESRTFSVNVLRPNLSHEGVPLVCLGSLGARENKDNDTGCVSEDRVEVKFFFFLPYEA